MKFVNYKFANAIFTTRNGHYGLEAKVSGSGNIVEMTIDSLENKAKFEKLPKRQQALLLQSLTLEACNKAGELKRREIKVAYEQLFDDLYLNCEAEEEADAKKRTENAMQRAAERGFDARGQKLQSAVNNMVQRERHERRGKGGWSGDRNPRGANRPSMFGRSRAMADQRKGGDFNQQRGGAGQRQHQPRSA
eukprot:CAMPEP_0117445126 /NCGR_PEP_ID=MMETSP0759-20121206/5623_1 /TAXON_ID=63605 /ORGANISM="Percolomonas cosmopolitus, Strain WS" /LENGTH=191 /DNA_ID=CAMNT_0005237269 /DNA_START=262 /DNA_END=837 /DNA_ORIENTATION=+